MARRRSYPIEFHMMGLKWENWTVTTTYTLQKLLEWSVSHNMADEYTRSGLLTNFTIEEVNAMLPLHTEDMAFEDVTTIKDEDIPAHLINPDYLQT